MSIDEVQAEVEPAPSEGELLRRVDELAPLIRDHVDWQEDAPSHGTRGVRRPLAERHVLALEAASCWRV